MIQINPLKSYIDGGVRAALTTPPSASLVFDLPGKAIWVKGVKLKGTDHTYTFSHDNYITLTNTPDSNESEDIKIGVNTSALKNAIDTTYGVVSTTANGLAPKFTSGNKLAATAATTYYFLGWTGSTLKWYQAPFRNIRINSETTDRLGVNNTDPLIISSGNGISVTWDSTNKKIIITNTKPDVNHNTDTKVALSVTTLDKNYAVILKGNDSDEGSITTVNFSTYLKFNPSTKLLTINGNKVITTIDTFVGATTSADGSVGLVTKPLIANRLLFLRGDGTWATPTNTWRPVKVEGTEKLGSNALDLSAGNGISIIYNNDTKKIVITNTKPDVNHNTDRTGIKLATVSGTKKTDSTLILANSTTGLGIQGGTNKFLIGNGTNYIEVPVVPSVSNKDATIGTTLTTLATVAGVDIKAKIASYSLSNHTHSVKINGSTKTITSSGTVDLGDYLPSLRMRNPSNGTSEQGGIPFPISLKGAGYPVYTDPEFTSGYNNIAVYNNSSNGAVTISRILDNQGSSNSSGYILQISTTTNTASPGRGGFVQTIYSRKNAVFAQIFRAKIPIGFNVVNAENPMGKGYSTYWLTDTAGTGKWEWYIRVTICGTDGSFSSGGHVYLSGSGAVTWYLSYCNLIDLTKGNYDGLRTRYSDYATSANNADTATNVDWSGIKNKPNYAAGDAIGGSANYLRWEKAASSSYARKIPISWYDNKETTTTRFRAVYSDSLTYRTDTNTISSNISGNANTSNRTKFLETFKQGSTTDTYGTSYPIWAQWTNNTNVRLKCTNYTVWVDKSDYSTSSGNASTATKLTSSAGSTTLPIYFSDGKPVACTASSVFSNLSNSGNNLSVTVAGLNRTLIINYANNAGNADKLDNYHESDFFRYRGELYQKNNYNANTLKIGEYIFRSSGYGNVGTGTSHTNVLSENSTIQVFKWLLMSAGAWSDSMSYRLSWGGEQNTQRPNGWSPWITFISSSNYKNYVNTTNFPGLNKVGTVTSVTVTGSNGLSGTGTITTSGTITLSNAGVRSTTINGNYLRVNTNGTNTDLTIPYTINSDKVDEFHAMSAGSLLYKYKVTATIPASSITGDFWYATITFSRNYVYELTKSLIDASYSNKQGLVYLNTYEYNGAWYVFTTNYNGCNIKGIALKTQNNPIYYVKLAKPTTYNNTIPNGIITVYSPYNCTITVSSTAPSGVTFTNITVPGFTNLKANSASMADLATTATYASNVGTAGTAGTNYVAASKVIATCNWYDTMIGSDTDTVINRWSEIVAFVANFKETPDLATYLSNNYLAKSGGTMIGPLKWANDTALPVQTSPKYFVCIDAFADGGTTKYASKVSTLKALTGLTSTAIGDSDEPVYWNGTTFIKAGAYPTKASWNYDDIYSKLGHTHDNYVTINTNQTITNYKIFKIHAPVDDRETVYYNIGLKLSSYGDNHKKVAAIGMGNEPNDWYKAAIGFERTNTYDRGDIVFLLNNKSDRTTCVYSDIKVRINANGNINTLGSISANEFIKTNSSNSYILLGGGGHKAESSLRVAYASSAGNADTLDGYHANGLLTALSNSNKGISITVGGTNKSINNINVNGADTILGTSPQIAAATEHNSIYVSSPGYTSNKPVKMLCFDWYGNYWALSNIRSGSEPSAGFGVFFKNTEIARFTSDGNLSCNTSSATKLATARKIWGQSFDGTRDVSGSLVGTGTITASAAATYDIGSNTLDYRYGYFQWIGAKSNTNLRLAANNSDNQIVLHTNRNVGIGTNTPSYKLHVTGDIYTTTGFKKNGSSDSYVLLGGGGHKLISDFATIAQGIGTVISINKSLTPTTSWIDTGIKTDSATFPEGNGSYIVQISIPSSSGTDGWGDLYTGYFSLFTGTNSSTEDEILLHGASHSLVKRIYLKTKATAKTDGTMHFYIASEKAFSAARNINFKFRKLI